MSTEVATRTTTWVVPVTGEVLDLEAATPGELASVLEQVRDLESQLRDGKRLLSEVLHKHLDAQASWTLRDGEYEIRGESPERVDYDVDVLRKELTRLIADNVITVEAAQAALKREVTFKPAKRGINALLKLGGRVAEAIKSCERPVDRPRRITLKRST